VALLLMIVSFFAKVDGGVKWAGFVLLARGLQWVLAIVAFEVPWWAPCTPSTPWRWQAGLDGRPPDAPRAKGDRLRVTSPRDAGEAPAAEEKDQPRGAGSPRCSGWRRPS
jgi:hypothetical protein